MKNKMNEKENIIILVIAFFVLVLVGLNVFIYMKRSKPSYTYKVVKNADIRRDHCVQDLCFHDMKIIDAISDKKIVIHGTIENQASSDFESDVEFTFTTAKGVISYVYPVKLKANEKMPFEAQPEDRRLLKVKDYSIKIVKK